MLKVSKSICRNRRFGNPTKGRHQKLDYANYDQFAPNFNVTYKTIQRVSVPNLKLFGGVNIVLWAKEAGEFSVTLYGKMA